MAMQQNLTLSSLLLLPPYFLCNRVEIRFFGMYRDDCYLSPQTLKLISAPQELFHDWGVPLVTALCCLIKLHYTEAVQFELELAVLNYSYSYFSMLYA